MGGVKDYYNTLDLLENASIDYFALSRPLLTEPKLIKRWKEGDRSPVKCIRCSRCRTDKGNYCVVFS